MVQLRPHRLSYQLTLPGTVQAVSQATVRAKLAAEMKHVLVRAAALQELGGTWPNLHATLSNLSRNRFLHGVRSNDIETEDWMQPQRIGRMLREALDMLYY